MKPEDILGLAIPVAFILAFDAHVGFGRPAPAAMPAMLVFAEVNGERWERQ